MTTRFDNAFSRCARRCAGIRRNDQGQVTLLSGMMLFVAVIMTLFTMDTARVIYHRVIAQNAVDAAADTAALWQARGCNLLQHLNNTHYAVNIVAFIAEAGTLTCCVAAPILALVPFVGGGLMEAACLACNRSPEIDDLQKMTADAIVNAQTGIKTAFPILAFAHANAAAKGSQADNFFDVLGGYVDNISSVVGFSIPGLGNIAGVLSSVTTNLVYAMPIDVNSLDLQVDKKKGDGLPWDWTFTFEYIAVGAGQATCQMRSPSGENDWGWDDEYYWGNPGLMTWMAGKKRYEEGAGLGSLIWFHGEQEDMDIHSQLLYSGSQTAASELKLPAVMAFASSQIEGEPVVSKGTANATPKLITVHFPPADNPKKGEDYLIYH